MLGSSSPYILIDTGEGKLNYSASLLSSALGPEGRICDIIISHRHKDHWGGLKAVLELLSRRQGAKPRVWKWPSPEHDGEIASSMPRGTYEPSADGTVLWPIDANRVRLPFALCQCRLSW